MTDALSRLSGLSSPEDYHGLASLTERTARLWYAAPGVPFGFARARALLGQGSPQRFTSRRDGPSVDARVVASVATASSGPRP